MLRSSHARRAARAGPAEGDAGRPRRRCARAHADLAEPVGRRGRAGRGRRHRRGRGNRTGGRRACRGRCAARRRWCRNRRHARGHVGAVRPPWTYPAVRRRRARRGDRPRGRGDLRSRPARRRARHRRPACRRHRGGDRRARRRGRRPVAGVPAPPAQRPAVRRVQVGDHGGRGDRRGRRVVAVDHRRRGAHRLPPAARRERRDRRRRGHRAARRPVAHGSPRRRVRSPAGRARIGAGRRTGATVPGLDRRCRRSARLPRAARRAAGDGRGRAPGRSARSSNRT